MTGRAWLRCVNYQHKGVNYPPPQVWRVQRQGLRIDHLEGIAREAAGFHVQFLPGHL